MTSTRKSQCPVVLKAKANKEADHLVITHVSKLSDHNHPTTPNLAKYYPRNRKLDLAEINVTSSLLTDCVSARKVTNKINSLRTAQKHVGTVLTKDIHNLKSRVTKLKLCGLTQADLLLNVKIKICREFPEASVEFVKRSNVPLDEFSDSSSLLMIFVQTPIMRAWLVANPSVYFSDVTYRLNVENFNLLAVVVQDRDGFALPVAFGLICSETQSVICHFFRMLSNSMPNFASPESIFVDKDFTQMSVLTEIFPTSNIFICAFHICKIWKTEIAKERIDITEKHALFQNLRSMMYCTSTTKFAELLAQFRAKSSAKLMDHNTMQTGTDCVIYGLQLTGKFVLRLPTTHSNKTQIITLDLWHRPHIVDDPNDRL